MARTIEAALTKEQQRTAKIVPVDDTTAWVVWHEKDRIGIEQATNCAEVWECDHAQTWPAATMFAVADLITNDVAKNRPAPKLDAALDALKCDPYSTVRAKWHVPIDDKTAMIVFRYDYREVPSLKLKTFARKDAWEDVTYTILDEKSAFELAKHIAGMRGGAKVEASKAPSKIASKTATANKKASAKPPSKIASKTTSKKASAKPRSKTTSAKAPSKTTSAKASAKPRRKTANKKAPGKKPSKTATKPRR